MAMGETVCERMWWETGSFTEVDGLGEETVGMAVGAAVGDGSTLRGGTTLGDSNAVGGDGVVGSLAGGASAVVVVNFLKRSRRLEMDDSCLWWTVMAVSLVSQYRKLRAWTILSSGLTSGWVRY